MYTYDIYNMFEIETFPKNYVLEITVTFRPVQILR